MQEVVSQETSRFASLPFIWWSALRVPLDLLRTKTARGHMKMVYRERRKRIIFLECFFPGLVTNAIMVQVLYGMLWRSYTQLNIYVALLVTYAYVLLLLVLILPVPITSISFSSWAFLGNVMKTRTSA